MKNCELFADEEGLKRAWEKRKALLGITSDEDFTKWSCFQGTDFALQDKFDRGKLLVHNGKEYVLSLGASKTTCNGALIYVAYIDKTGQEYHDSVFDRGKEMFVPAALPPGVLDLAKAMVMEELQKYLALAYCDLRERLYGKSPK